MKYNNFLLIVMAIIMIFSTMTITTASASDEMKLRFAAVSPPPPATIAIGYDYFQKRVTELSGGKITFENFYSGSLLSAKELLYGVQKKVADMAMGLPLLFPAKMPLAAFDTYFPFSPADIEMSVKVKSELFKMIPAFNEEHEKNGIKQLFVFTTGSYDIQSNVPIRTLEDLKGKKMAAAGSSLPKWLPAAGAVPISLPGAERYVGLQRGTIDGSILNIISAGADRHYEVAKYYTYVDLGAPAIMYCWINLEVWKSISQEQRNIFEQAASEAQAWTLSEIKKGISEYKKIFEENDVTFFTLSDADKAAWAKAMPDLPAEWAKEVEKKGLPGWHILDEYIRLTKQEGYKWPREWGKR